MNSLEEIAIEVAQKMDDVFLRNVPADVLRSYAGRLAAAFVLPSVPEGWQMVPKVPTYEMCKAVHFGPNCAEEKLRSSDREFWEACYSAMLAAAPSPQEDKPLPAVSSETMIVPKEILDRFPEINPSNYDHDDVCALNAWGAEVMLAAETR